MWTRRPTKIGRQTAAGDFTVVRRGQDVGRVCPSVSISGLSPFAWSTWTYPADNGRADTLDQALDQLREAVRRRWPDDVEQVPLAASQGKNT